MHWTLVLTLCAALVVAAPSQDSGGSTHATDETAIKAVIADRWIAGWNNHDVHQFASAFAEDADFTNVRGQSASGKANIEKFHADVFERLFKQSHQTHEVTKIRFIKPDVAAVDVQWEMTGALDNQTGKPLPYRTGIANCIFTKVQGQWLISVLHNAELTPWVQPPQR